jgi:CPA1 family monovalent cation:H+ antiporter
MFALQVQEDEMRAVGEYEDVEPKRLRRHRLEDAIVVVLSRLKFLAFLAARLHLNRITLDYEMAVGRYHSSRRVLDTLDTLARLDATPWYIVDKVRRQYRKKCEEAQKGLDQIAEQFPEFINDLQERLGRRLLLAAEAETIAKQAEHGALPQALAGRLEDEIAEELRMQKGTINAGLSLEPVELLRKLPTFQELTIDMIANIAVRMRLAKVAEKETIIRQGEPGDSIYFIAHGVARVRRDGEGGPRDVATLMAGDFFGEASILSGETRNATVVAVTECLLYRLRAEDLEVAMETYPAIRRALEQQSENRKALHSEA